MYDNTHFLLKDKRWKGVFVSKLEEHEMSYFESIYLGMLSSGKVNYSESQE